MLYTLSRKEHFTSTFGFVKQINQTNHFGIKGLESLKIITLNMTKSNMT